MQFEQIGVVLLDDRRFEVVYAQPGEASDTTEFILVPLGTEIRTLVVPTPADEQPSETSPLVLPEGETA